MKSDLLTARMVLQKLGVSTRASLWKTVTSQKAQLKKEGRFWNPESYVESHAQMKDGVPYGLFGGQDKLPEPRAMLRIVEAALERVHEQQFEDGDDGGDELFENQGASCQVLPLHFAQILRSRLTRPRSHRYDGRLKLPTIKLTS